MVGHAELSRARIRAPGVGLAQPYYISDAMNRLIFAAALSNPANNNCRRNDSPRRCRMPDYLDLLRMPQCKPVEFPHKSPVDHGIADYDVFFSIPTNSWRPRTPDPEMQQGPISKSGVKGRVSEQSGPPSMLVMPESTACPTPR